MTKRVLRNKKHTKRVTHLPHSRNKKAKRDLHKKQRRISAEERQTGERASK